MDRHPRKRVDASAASRASPSLSASSTSTQASFTWHRDLYAFVKPNPAPCPIYCDSKEPIPSPAPDLPARIRAVLLEYLEEQTLRGPDMFIAQVPFFLR
ncbi:hypothetical protein JCM3766R1_004435 [Sporobolomyces carnicolor]